MDFPLSWVGSLNLKVSSALWISLCSCWTRTEVLNVRPIVEKRFKSSSSSLYSAVAHTERLRSLLSLALKQHFLLTRLYEIISRFFLLSTFFPSHCICSGISPPGGFHYLCFDRPREHITAWLPWMQFACHHSILRMKSPTTSPCRNPWVCWQIGRCEQSLLLEKSKSQRIVLKRVYWTCCTIAWLLNGRWWFFVCVIPGVLSLVDQRTQEPTQWIQPCWGCRAMLCDDVLQWLLPLNGSG